MSRNSEVRKLARDVFVLSDQLGRPVSSRDLERFYRAGAERPLLMQCLGQALMKATHDKARHSSGHIVKVGIYGNLAFYAPDSGREWKRKFQRFQLTSRLEREITIGLPSLAKKLIGTEFEALASNAMAGFVQEFAPMIESPDLKNWIGLSSARQLVERAKELAANQFDLVEPTPLISRLQAAAFLRDEYARRMTEVDPIAMNVRRHLAVLRWPQSSLFLKKDDVFWPCQLMLLCDSKWPVGTIDEERAGSLLKVLRYGPGPSQTTGRL